MEIISSLITKLIPLYLVILLGYLVGRYSEINQKTISNLLINLISPVITFGYIAQSPFNYSTIAIPITSFLIGMTIGFSFYYLSKAIFKDSTANLVALAASTGNIGYFGIPLFVMLFGDEGLGSYMLAVTGYLFYDYTVGYYFIARGHYNIRASVKHVAKLPPMYATLAGLIFSLMHLSVPPLFSDLLVNFRGAFVVLGTLLVGTSISRLRIESIDWKYLLVTFAGKFLAFPLLAFLIITIDRTILHFYHPVYYHILFIFSVVPLMVNVVIFASHLDVQPEKAAAAVFISTIFALFYIPICFILFQIFI
ncbi:MAG TPA: AEC family transporter [bacterium]